MNEATDIRGLGPFKTILYSLIPMVLLFGSLECCARVYEYFYPPLPLDYGWGFNEGSRLFVSEAGNDGYRTNPEKAAVSFQEQHFEMPKPAGVYRIFLLGGSTIHGYHKAQEEIADFVAERVPNPPHIEVVNCGGLGYGSQRLVLIAHEIMAYEPDLVMLYTGHNEFEEKELLHYVDVEGVPFQRILYASALCRLVRDRIAYRHVSLLQREKNASITAPNVDYAGVDFTPEEIAERMTAFERNLRNIVKTCREHEVDIVMGTVPSNMTYFRVPTRRNDEVSRIEALYTSGRYEEGHTKAREFIRHASRHQASDTENEILLRVAGDFEVPVARVREAVAAAEPNGVPGETLFGDHCHLLPEDMTILAKEFSKVIAPLVEEHTR
jgi:lysophospholipase L1-like esterase